MMTSLQLWDGQVHSRTLLEDFFKICQREEISADGFFKPNTMDPAQLVLPSGI